MEDDPLCAPCLTKAMLNCRPSLVNCLKRGFCACCADDKKKVIVVKVEKEEPKKDAKVVYLVEKKP